MEKSTIPVELEPCGWLAERVDRAYVAVRNLRASLWWPGSIWGYEHVARWIRNVTIHDPRHPALRGTVDKLLSLVHSGRAFADYEKLWLAAYNEEELLAGLLAYHRVFQEPEVLEAARRVGGSIVRNHPRLAGNHYYKSLAIGPLLDLADMTGDPVFREGAVAIAEDQQLAVLRQSQAHGAAAGMILCGLVKLAERTGKGRYMDWALELREALRMRQFITGGLGECLDFTAPPSESDLHDETCQHSYWMMANLALWRATRDPGYLEQVERTFYNHFLFAQLHRGEDGGFCALGDVDQGFRGQHNYICCDNEGFFGLKELIRHAITADRDGLSIHFILPLRVHADGMSLRVETGFPARGTAILRVEAASPDGRRLRIRLPERAIARINGEPAAGSRENGYTTIHRRWSPGDTVQVEFPLPVRIEADNTGIGATSVSVRVNGQVVPAKRIGVFQGPVLAALFRAGHGNALSWVWNGDYPEALESNGGEAEGIEAAMEGGLARLRWTERQEGSGAVEHEVSVLPGFPVTLEWRETQAATGQPCGWIRYATAKQVLNPRYGSIAFPYPFPAVTTRDDLRGTDNFVAGGGSFSLAERLENGADLPVTGTVRLSNGSFRTICHYDRASVGRVTAHVANGRWAGVAFHPAGRTLHRRLVFPLYDQPLSQDLTLMELTASRQVRASIREDGNGNRVLDLSGEVIEQTPVLIPKASGLKPGQWAGTAELADYDGNHLIARLPVPGSYRLS